MENWYDLELPANNWLVDGLITSDGFASFCGKPKAGKSTLLRALIAAVIKNKTFLGRSIDIPDGEGRVLYIHLDRKDHPARVATELKQMGITGKESTRLTLRVAQDIPETYEERLHWLQTEVLDLEGKNAAPQLIVIDLLWQFVVAKNNNDYNAVLNGINLLQKALEDVKYKGALIVTLHSRKAESPDDSFDDTLGSTGQRGSFATGIMLKRYRNEGLYTLASDQTQRDIRFGEIEETVLEYVGGIPVLGATRATQARKEKLSKTQEAEVKVLSYIQEHPGCDQKSILTDLRMAKKTLLPILKQIDAFITTDGAGEKGNPYKYSAEVPMEIMEVANV